MSAGRPAQRAWQALSLRQLSLRRRLGLLIAVAVALGIALASVVAFVSSRQELQDQVDATLLSQAQIFETALPLGTAEGPLYAVFPAIQVVGPDGEFTTVYGLTLPVDRLDELVAQGRHGPVFRDVTVGGHHLRMVTVPYGTYEALQLTASLAPVDHSLHRLAAVLTVVGVAGAALALAAGLAVTRTGLAPLGELTAAVERIARTDDLSTPLPVRPGPPGHHPDEVSRLAGSFSGMLAALGASRERQRRLVSDASHELRTPLTSLRTNIELLVRSERSGRALPAQDRAQLLADLSAQTEELGALVGELTALARDAPAEQSGPVDLAEIVTEAVERVRRRSGAVTIHVELEPTPLLGQPVLLERAVVNLLDNAVKFSPPGGEIFVGLRDRGLLVVDQGPGIPAEDLPHVFERFYRSATTRGLPGSGLGLAIVAEAAAAHRATVSLEPGRHGGTAARLLLPPP